MTINLSAKNVAKTLQFVLLVSILGILLWSNPLKSSDTRKITVTGESVIKAEPDEFVFNPYFELKGADKDALKAELTEQTSEVVAALKELGVEDKDMKLDASSYDRWYWPEGEDGVLNATLRINVSDKELVQKIQNYLLTTEAIGQLTPQATFSEAKKKELDNQAVEQAIDDAKAKAELQAKKFEAKVGKVLEVSQQQNSIFPISYGSADLSVSGQAEDALSLPVLSGENEYRQTVTVIYELK